MLIRKANIRLKELIASIALAHAGKHTAGIHVIKAVPVFRSQGLVRPLNPGPDVLAVQVQLMPFCHVQDVA